MASSQGWLAAPGQFEGGQTTPWDFLILQNPLPAFNAKLLSTFCKQNIEALEEAKHKLHRKKTTTSRRLHMTNIKVSLYTKKNR